MSEPVNLQALLLEAAAMLGNEQATIDERQDLRRRCVAAARAAAMLQPTPPAASPEKDPYPNTCNRHLDCEAAVQRWLEAHPGSERHHLPADFCCRDESCEDCFGR